MDQLDGGSIIDGKVAHGNVSCTPIFDDQMFILVAVSDVPCFKTMICGVPAVWEFDQKSFYVSVYLYIGSIYVSEVCANLNLFFVLRSFATNKTVTSYMLVFLVMYMVPKRVGVR